MPPVAGIPVLEEMLRALALTMPEVTVLVNPKGLPTASTHSPTWRCALLPIGITCRSAGASIFSSAMSVVGSAPTTVAVKLRLSLRVTSRVSASAITWLLVTI